MKINSLSDFCENSHTTTKKCNWKFPFTFYAKEYNDKQ